ncbi:MAG: nucleotidyltransferase domain-containing protein [Candidatus Nanohaloarchaea archaeon]|nr:nucleotidyltransferase domain-containing protein [Candidatus Nanohaloarchaea archaeon]
MVSLTENEARAIDLLLRNFKHSYNINQVARELDLSPRGANKILKRLENRNILVSEYIGNSKIYSINFANDATADVCQFVLTGNDTTPYIRTWINDLQPLKEHTEMAVLFGSVLAKERRASDIDILIVVKEEKFKRVKNEIEDIEKVKPKEIHPIFQTPEDIIRNIGEEDPVVLRAIRTGMVLWGRDVFVRVIKDGRD